MPESKYPALILDIYREIYIGNSGNREYLSLEISYGSPVVNNHHSTPNDEPSLKASAAAKFPNIQSGRYRFLEVVGSGNKGIVYKALDTALDKIVAIKKLHAVTEGRQAIRFQREAKVVGTLNHPNVMTALDFGLTDKNEPYLVLNFFEGESLAERLQRTGPLSVDEAIPILAQIAAGLSHAHHKNVVHRDIKPTNMMLIDGSDGTPVVQIVDFGLAKQHGKEQGVTTSSGPGVGTPSYMSSEQVRGSKIDTRSDIYSFGCLMFETFTGVPPIDCVRKGRI